MLDQAPVNTRDWIRCAPPYVLTECMLRTLTESQRLDDRRFAFNVQTGGGESHYFSVETHRDLVHFEKVSVVDDVVLVLLRLVHFEKAGVDDVVK